MGDRAVITDSKHKTAIYLHWNGGPESVTAFLRFCEKRGYRAPNTDCYGWSYLVATIANFFSNGLSVGICDFESICKSADVDNGIYVIENWEIKDHFSSYDHYKACLSHYDNIDEDKVNAILSDVNASQPMDMRVANIN